MKKIIEIRSAEGGADSQMFVGDLANAYRKFFDRKGWKNRIIKDRPSDAGHYEITLEVEGKKLQELDQEAGGLRLQRVSPTEKRGRVHTSTVTVAVMGEESLADPKYDLREDHHFYVEWFSGTGKGGQHRNKHQNSCRLYHLPTNLVESRQGRSRENNLKDAKAALLISLNKAKFGENHSELASMRKEQIGSGMRGDKVRTIRFQDNIITDHRSGRTSTAKKFMSGKIDELWK